MTVQKEISIWSRSLLSILEDGEKNEKTALERLVFLLKKRKKLYILPQIIKKTEKSYLKKNKIELLLAKDHSHDVVERVKKSFPGVFGKGSSVKIKIDEDLIGGFRIKTHNLLVSASVLDFLEEIKNKVING